MALIAHYQPSDDEICFTFNLTKDELSVAKNLEASGAFGKSKTLNVERFGNPFKKPPPPQVFATKRVFVKEQKPKGSKILTALKAIPRTPTPVDQFVKEYNVSVAVLRQSKRFIKALPPEEANSYGSVHVTKDKTTNQMVIWRD